MRPKPRRKRSHDPVTRWRRKSSGEYPAATIAYYGPDDRQATKVAVGIIPYEAGDAAFLERWWSQGGDVRFDPKINRQIADFIAGHGVQSVIMTDRVIGCPHEEGVDYPKGESCPQCPFWANRDRWTGELLH